VAAHDGGAAGGRRPHRGGRRRAVRRAARVELVARRTHRGERSTDRGMRLGLWLSL